MSCAPGLLIFHKRSKRNPYADRGLAEFARVAAELEAKRKKLFVELGTQLSLVRFASASDHSNWVPIIICPSLSSDEIRALRKTATNLIYEDAGAHKEKSTHTSIAERQGHLTKPASSSAQNHPSGIKSVRSRDATGHVSAVGGFSQMLSAAEKFLWMAAFGLSIVADILGNLLRLKPHPVTPSKTRPSSSKQVTVNRSSATSMSSSAITPSLVLPETATSAMPARPRRARIISPPHPLHIKDPKTHIKGDLSGCSTAPSTPTNSRERKRPFQASVSLPKTGECKGDVAKQKQLCTTTSLPKTIRLQESDTQKDSSATVTSKIDTGRMDSGEREEGWGQALAGAGLALGLSGLVMGYIPAIVGVVCWWYLLPNWRKALGEDKPIIKSQHHQKAAC